MSATDSDNYVMEKFHEFLSLPDNSERISSSMTPDDATIEFTLDEIRFFDERLATEIFNSEVQRTLDIVAFEVAGKLHPQAPSLSKVEVMIKGAPHRYDIDTVEYREDGEDGHGKRHCSIDVWEVSDTGERFVKLRDSHRGLAVTLRGKDLVRAHVMRLLDRTYGDEQLQLISKITKKLTPYFATIQEKEEREFSDETQKRALELAKDPNLLRTIGDDIGKGHVGDEESRLLVFVLLSSSRLLGHEQSLIIQKASGAGGSDLQNKVLAYFDNVKAITRMTGAVPDRIGKDFTGQILKVEELKGTEAAQNSLRVMISEGNLALWTTQKDENGNIGTVEIKTKGTPTFITTTIDYQIEEQFLNRLWIVGVDESKDQTRAIVRHQFGKFSGLQDDYSPSDLITCLISPKSKILDSDLKVLIPYADMLGDIFPADTTPARRDSLKLATLIAINAWLHQHQRPVIRTEKTSYVVAVLKDLIQVLNYAPTALKNTLFKLNERGFTICCVG